MSVPKRRAVLLAVSGIALAGFAAYAYLHRGAAPMQFQGWVEAELLFIAPDEVGRVETLNVQRGPGGGGRCAAVQPGCGPAARGGGRERGGGHQRAASPTSARRSC